MGFAKRMRASPTLALRGTDFGRPIMAWRTRRSPASSIRTLLSPMPRSYAPIVERFDVIVVGAGPAGSLTAHLLAAGGARTLLVDRARFPRDKPCGGGVTMRGLRLLPFAIGPVVERQITTIAFRHPGLGAFEHGGIAPVVLMTQRKRLDAFLAEQAALAGADFRDGVKLRARRDRR